MPTPRLTNEVINAAILGFEGQKNRTDAQIAELRAMVPSSNGSKPETKVHKKRGMSVAGRAAVAEAQRKRWAATKEQSVAKPAKKVKRKLSPEGRAAIIAATKKRWAAKRAAAMEPATKAAKKTASKK
jgi:hypothetical protein